MGAYINPKDTTKEVWLSKNAEHLANPDELDYMKLKKEGYLPVVWVDNGAFTAAIICFSEDEWQYVHGTRDSDTRPRKYYKAKTESLHEVSNQLEKYLQIANKQNQ